ncbi:MAG TPA: hypothetical protein VJW73_24075 [Gemmatimonadaceae bacterium]|nr:hypothetical protein [Gemmatimonadaceae bacterium]
MNRHELEQWLGDRHARPLALSDIADVLHVIIEASRQPVALDDADALRELRFAVAVLRDVFARDDEVRRWLLAPSAAVDGLTPADLLSSGCVREFTDLAIAEWNHAGAEYAPAETVLERRLERR